MPFPNGRQESTPPVAESQQLQESGTCQTERAVELTARVTETVYICQIELVESHRRSHRVAHVNDRYLDPGRFNRRSLIAKICQVGPAEGTSAMPQKHD